MPKVKSSFKSLLENATKVEVFRAGHRRRPVIPLCRVPHSAVHRREVDLLHLPYRPRLRPGETFVLHLSADTLQQSEGDLSRAFKAIVKQLRDEYRPAAPFPLQLDWEIWRLRTTRQWSHERIAQNAKLAPHFGGRATEKSRTRRAKRACKAVDAFLATPEGEQLRADPTSWFNLHLKRSFLDPA